MNNADMTRAAMAVTTATLGSVGRADGGDGSAEAMIAVGREIDHKYEYLCFGFLHVIQALADLRRQEQGATFDETLALVAQALGQHP